MKMIHTNKDSIATEISIEVTGVEAGNPKLVVTLPATDNPRDYAKGGKEHWRKALVAEAFAYGYRHEHETAFQLNGDPSQPGNTLTFNPLVAAGIDDFYYIQATNPVVDRKSWPDFMHVAVGDLKNAGFVDPEQQRRQQPQAGESVGDTVKRIIADHESPAGTSLPSKGERAL